MKKLITLIAVITCIEYSFGQSQRMVLVEEFTQASAPPCGFQNPAFDSLLQANATKVIPIKYHVSWPAFDPMYNHSSTDANFMTTYYGVTGIPHGFMDGSMIINDCGYYDGAPACLSQSEIDAAYAVSSPLQLFLTHNLSADGDSVYATLIINATGSVSGTLRARVAITEEHIHFSTSPGGNGETEFYNVMKKMLPNGNGTLLPATLNTGYTDTLEFSWKISNVYDMNQIAVAAWVQNTVSKQVLQAVYSSPQPFPLYAFVSSLTNNSITCSGSITPTITLHNGGTTTVSSAVIDYSIDSIPTGSYSWNGLLISGNDITLNLPAVAVSGSHIYSTWVSQINGNTFNLGQVLYHSSMSGIGAAANVPVTEGFVSAAFPPANWILLNPDEDLTWQRNSLYGGFQMSTNSVMFPYFNVPLGTTDELFIQNFDLSNTSQTQATMQFAIAKADYQDTAFIDRLMVMSSIDCGQTWNTLYDKTDATGLSTVVDFNPWHPAQVSDWREDIIDISSLIGNNNVIIKLKTISGFGNNMYIDDINIHYGPALGINEQTPLRGINIFPNPATDILTIRNPYPSASETKINVYDVTGRRIVSHSTKLTVYPLDISSLDAGIYICEIDNTVQKYSALFTKNK